MGCACDLENRDKFLLEKALPRDFAMGTIQHPGKSNLCFLLLRRPAVLAGYQADTAGLSAHKLIKAITLPPAVLVCFSWYEFR
jgi:hypothetical protein